MITKEQAMAAQHGDSFHYTGRKPCKRHPEGPRGRAAFVESVTVRVSGKCKTWKTRPEHFRLPVKHGLYENSAITHENAGDWHVPGDCPAVERAPNAT